MTPTNPSSLFPRQQLHHGQSSRPYQCDSCAVINSFHQLRETLSQWIHMSLGREKYISKHDFPSHLSVVPAFPWVTQTGSGNDCFLPEPALKAGYEARCHGGAMFLLFHPALCIVWFTTSPSRCFICDLVFPGQMAIGCLTCPLCACRTIRWKKMDKGQL